jgi:hypothetical protein
MAASSFASLSILQRLHPPLLIIDGSKVVNFSVICLHRPLTVSDSSLTVSDSPLFAVRFILDCVRFTLDSVRLIDSCLLSDSSTLVCCQIHRPLFAVRFIDTCLLSDSSTLVCCQIHQPLTVSDLSTLRFRSYLKSD